MRERLLDRYQPLADLNNIPANKKIISVLSVKIPKHI
jgi:hypothetical protein